MLSGQEAAGAVYNQL